VALSLNLGDPPQRGAPISRSRCGKGKGLSSRRRERITLKRIIDNDGDHNKTQMSHFRIYLNKQHHGTTRNNLQGLFIIGGLTRGRGVRGGWRRRRRRG